MLVPVVDECMIIPIAPYTGASVHLVFRLIFANFNKINKYMPFCRPTEALTRVARSFVKLQAKLSMAAGQKRPNQKVVEKCTILS